MYLQVEYPYQDGATRGIRRDVGYILYDPRRNMNVDEWKRNISDIFGNSPTIICALLRPFDLSIDIIYSMDQMGRILFSNYAEAYAFVDVEDVNIIYNSLKSIEHSEEAALVNDELFKMVLLFNQGHPSMEVFGEMKHIKRIADLFSKIMVAKNITS